MGAANPLFSLTGTTAMPLTALKHNVQLSELDAWGTVADLGSQILEGDVRAFGKM